MTDKQHLEKQFRSQSRQKTYWQITSVILFVICLIVLIVWKVNPKQQGKFVLESEHKLLDPALPLVDKKDLITNIQPIREFYRKLEAANRENFNIGIYFEYLQTGSNVSINNDFKIWPASLTKLPLGLIIMKKVETGEWNLTDELVLLEEDLDTKSGNLYETKSIGSRFTVNQLLTKLLVDSDNTAYKILYRNIPEADYKSLIEAIGLNELFDKDGKITPKEYSRLLRSLYYSTFLEPKNSEKVLDLLALSTFHGYLSQGIPESVKFAHKYGENVDYNLFSDFGIVYVKNRPYILAVSIESKMADKEKSLQKVDQLMKEISKTAYEYIQSY